VTKKEPNALVATIHRIQALAEFCGEKKFTDRKGLLYFDWHASGRDGASLYVDPKTGLTTVYSYLESGHNGDHYDCRDEMLSPEQAQRELTSLLEQYERKALEHAKREVKRDEEQALDRQARQRLADHLRKVL
jgi:hypothetical protein